MKFLNGITLLLLYQLLGEISAKLLQLPIPGPVIGMALLLLSLTLAPSLLPRAESTANQLLSHLSLLFVPAGVGIMVHGERLADQWPLLLLTLVISTLITMAAVGLTAKYCQRLNRRQKS